MSDLRVLGIGSPFGDDQLGWEVIKLLQQKPSLYPFMPHQLQLRCCDRPGIHLLELMRDASSVFLIDAVKTGAAMGSLHYLKNEEISQIASNLSTHALGIAEAMAMGAALQELPSSVVLYGIEIADIQVQFTLRPSIADAIHALALRIENDILLALQGIP